MSLAKSAAVLLTTAVLAPVVAACGGGSNFPDPPECVEPTPTPERRDERSNPGLAYLVVLDNGIKELRELTDEFELRWPGQRFSSRREFREEFVVYAGRSACLAEALMELEPGDPERLTEFDGMVDAALEQYLGVLERGREAVRKRNVSKYREFHRDLDDAYTRLEGLMQQVPR